MTNIDKQIEENRYDTRSLEILKSSDECLGKIGSDAVDLPLRKPYIVYEDKIKELVRYGTKVLEIGAGTGKHTKAIFDTGAYVTASDISKYSLELLKKNIDDTAESDRLTCIVADMEDLPFPDCFFDAVTCAGSLSYGEPAVVNKEILRVLKPDGMFIAIDSLNDNPVYRLNRYMHFLRGERSNSTLKRIPNFERINEFKKIFKTVEIQYFGSIVWLVPILRYIFGIKKTAAIVEWVDKVIKVESSAFKFVLVAIAKK